MWVSVSIIPPVKSVFENFGKNIEPGWGPYTLIPPPYLIRGLKIYRLGCAQSFLVLRINIAVTTVPATPISAGFLRNQSNLPEKSGLL